MSVVWAEVNFAGGIERIVKNRRIVPDHPVCRILQIDRTLAVGSIRRQIFWRSEGFCEMCGEIVLESSGHMHEKQHRGKGGEISLENSIFICAKCHQDAHKERNPRFTKKPLTSE